MKTGLPIILFLAGLLSCATPHKVMVIYDRPGALKPGDRVIWENQYIGSVGEFQANPAGKTVVPLQVKPDFRQVLTDQSRFLIQSDPDRPGNQSIKMVLLASGGKPLPDGAVVEGSTTFSYLIEKGSRDAQAVPELLQDGLDRLAKEWSRFSEREWQKELEQQIDVWTRELQKSGEETRRYFQREVLPKLEKAIQDLLRQLKELGREPDGKPLEDKLEELKRTLQSLTLHFHEDLGKASTS
jgi:paraquat-inducible protein B